MTSLATQAFTHLVKVAKHTKPHSHSVFKLLVMCKWWWCLSNWYCTGVSCGPLAAPSNGRVDTSAGTSFGDTAMYNCDTGYMLNGPAERTCQADGEWNGSVPTCEWLTNTSNCDLHRLGWELEFVRFFKIIFSCYYYNSCNLECVSGLVTISC